MLRESTTDTHSSLSDVISRIWSGISSGRPLRALSNALAASTVSYQYDLGQVIIHASEFLEINELRAASSSSQQAYLLITLWKRRLVRDIGTSALACHPSIKRAEAVVVQCSLDIPGIYEEGSHLKTC